MSDPSSSAHDPNALDPWTILDTLPDYLAVLDAGGTIRITVNQSEQWFATAMSLLTAARFLL